MTTMRPHLVCEPAANVVLGRVLLADDEPELRRLLRRSLGRAGYSVVEAANGLAALQLLRRERFDLLISDVRMPLMGGLDLLAWVSAEAPGLPVVLISGSSELLDRQSGLPSGAYAFLPKPISLAQLQVVSRRAIDERAHASGRGRSG